MKRQNVMFAELAYTNGEDKMEGEQIKWSHNSKDDRRRHSIKMTKLPTSDTNRRHKSRASSSSNSLVLSLTIGLLLAAIHSDAFTNQSTSQHHSPINQQVAPTASASMSTTTTTTSSSTTSASSKPSESQPSINLIPVDQPVINRSQQSMRPLRVVVESSPSSSDSLAAANLSFRSADSSYSTSGPLTSPADSDEPISTPQQQQEDDFSEPQQQQQQQYLDQPEQYGPPVIEQQQQQQQQILDGPMRYEAVKQRGGSQSVERRFGLFKKGHHQQAGHFGAPSMSAQYAAVSPFMSDCERCLANFGGGSQSGDLQQMEPLPPPAPSTMPIGPPPPLQIMPQGGGHSAFGQPFGPLKNKLFMKFPFFIKPTLGGGAGDSNNFAQSAHYWPPPPAPPLYHHQHHSQQPQQTRPNALYIRPAPSYNCIQASGPPLLAAASTSSGSAEMVGQLHENPLARPSGIKSTKGQYQQQQQIWLQQQQSNGSNFNNSSNHQQHSPVPTSAAQAEHPTASSNMLVDIQPSTLQQVHSNQQLREQQAGNNELIGYYFGSISRETAEWILRNHGQNTDGAYLLRSSGPQDDFVLSLMVVHPPAAGHHTVAVQQLSAINNKQSATIEVLHYKIVETEDSFVALHGQVGNEKFATIDELIDKAQGVATKPRWPIQRLTLDSQILPPTFWGLTVDQVRLAILIKAKQWGFPLSIFQQQPMSSNSSTMTAASNQTHLDHQVMGDDNNNISTTTTLNNETIRTLIYKSLHEFQPWFHGKISRDEAERRIESTQSGGGAPVMINGLVDSGGQQSAAGRDGRFLVRERDNFSYAMCISHKRTTKHYRIDVLPTGELAIQDGRKFTSLMALVSHYTIMSDGLWCALTEACPRPIQNMPNAYPNGPTFSNRLNNSANNNNIYCVPPPLQQQLTGGRHHSKKLTNQTSVASSNGSLPANSSCSSNKQNQPGKQSSALICPNQGAVMSIKAPIKEWLHTINHKWSQMIANKTNQQHQSLNSFLFGSSNPLNNHCRHNHRNHSHLREHRRRCSKNSTGHSSANCCSCSRHNHNHQQQRQQPTQQPAQQQQCQSDLPNAYSLQATNDSTLARREVCKCCSIVSPQDDTSFISGTNLRKGESGAFLPVSVTKNMTPLQCNTMGNNSRQTTTAAVNQLNGGDRSVMGSSNGTTKAVDSTKVLLSCLPQNSGFMLDGQSFIGSPLFAVKSTAPGTHSDSGGGFANRATSMNGVMSASGGGGGGTAQVIAATNANNVASEKLISPAQSIAADLNAAAQNPYSLQTDIYGSQTSTAIVNDQTLTSSSSSSGNNNTNNIINGLGGANINAHSQRHHHHHQQPLKQRQSSTGSNQAHHNVATTAAAQISLASSQLQQQQQQQQYGSVTAGQFVDDQATSARNNQLQMRSSHAAQSIQMQQRQQQPPMQSKASIGSVPHAGPIMCGQHAGPAYRYTNYTGESNTFKACAHSRAMGGSIAQTLCHRTADDLQLMTPSTQLAGPAALSKFVQFQDGQCLRTYRDTRSIQMAYLMSRQQEVAAAAAAAARAAAQNKWNQQQLAPASVRNQQQANRMQFAQSANQSAQVDLMQQHNVRLDAANHQQHNNSAQQQQIDFDLMDCDGKGFDFKYDPKLIKSSSIETLCGAGAEEEDGYDECQESLSQFKTNSELLMSQLRSCWLNNDTENNNQQTANNNLNLIDILTPTVIQPTGVSNEQQQQQNYSDNLNLAFLNAHSSQQEQRQYNNNYGVGENNNNEHNLSKLIASAVGDGIMGQFDDSMRKKHDLDELTTSQLAELTASLKAQVESKNRRSGLFNPMTTATSTTKNSMPMMQNAIAAQQEAPAHNNDNGSENNNSAAAAAAASTVERNSRELVNEFDTLVLNNGSGKR